MYHNNKSQPEPVGFFILRREIKRFRQAQLANACATRPCGTTAIARGVNFIKGMNDGS
jgi:hypothetical protein